MRKIKKKKLIVFTASAIFAALLFGALLAVRYFNEPVRFVESMLKSRPNFSEHPNQANRYFDKSFLSNVDLKQPAVLTPVHKSELSYEQNNPVVTLSYSKSVGQAQNSDAVIGFHLKRHGFYPWIYWNKIENVKLLDVRYLSDFSDIIPRANSVEKTQGEQFVLDGRFEISLENFKKIGLQEIDDQINKYSFDIKYKSKPLDFKALNIYVSLLGENDLVCVKSKKVEISDLTKNSQNVDLTVIGGFCRVQKIKIDKPDASSIFVNLK